MREQDDGVRPLDATADLPLLHRDPPAITGSRAPAALDSLLAVTDVALAAVSATLTAAADLQLARTGRAPATALSSDHVAAAVRSEVWLRGGEQGGFGPLSRLWPVADGWVRTHANYPWHRTALLSCLGLDPDLADDAAPDSVGAELATRRATEVQEQVYAAGGLAVAARTEAQWRATGGVPGGPLVALEHLDVDAPPLLPPGSLPAAGVRVLDLTRVIAGPVGTRMLAALGADVLRLDDPARPELVGQRVEGTVGKASGELDLGEAGDVLEGLLRRADVLVTGYRPGALDRFGLDAATVSRRHPGLIVAQLSAWGTHGPWAQRRGFDSLVQVASGIGWATSPDGVRPGVLPCQLLDHATGYLLAAGVLAALSVRAREGRGSHVRLSLARTATWLLDQGPRDVPKRDGVPEQDVAAFRVGFGDGWSGIAPPGALDGRPLAWPRLPPRYGTAVVPLEWSTT